MLAHCLVITGNGNHYKSIGKVGQHNDGKYNKCFELPF